jgi:hypothetical protein
MAPVVEEVCKSRILERVIKHCNRLNEASLLHEEEEDDMNEGLDHGKSVGSGKDLMNSKKIKRIPRRTHPVVSVRTVVTYMLAVTLGIKTADNARRVLMYSAPSLRHKGFFAVVRGVYPVQELCSTLTALSHARMLMLEEANQQTSTSAMKPDRNSTQTTAVKSPSRRRRRFMYRSVFLHAMATMRGMKPLYVWDSSRPWDEVQLQAFNARDNRSPLQLVVSGALNLLWFAGLYKYIQIALKKYFRLSQQFLQKRQEAAFAALSSQRKTDAALVPTSPPPPPPPPSPLYS